jgi:hypothetical protein
LGYARTPAGRERTGDADRSADGQIEFDYVCECADSTCFTSVRLPRSVYARITATAGWFVVAEGHGMPEEHVVEDGPGYLVVTRESG